MKSLEHLTPTQVIAKVMEEHRKSIGFPMF